MEDQNKKNNLNEKTAGEIVEETMKEYWDSAEKEKNTSNSREEKDTKDEKRHKVKKHSLRKESIDFSDDFEDENLGRVKEKNRKKVKKHISSKTKKTIWIIAGVILGVYLAVSIYFNFHFLPYQKINGVDVSGKTPDSVEKYMEEQVKGYQLNLIRSDGKKEVIKGKDIDAKYVPDDDVQNVLKKQNPFLWFSFLWDKKNIAAPVGVQYNDQKLGKQISKLNLMVEKNMTDSVSAYPEFKEGKFEIKDAVCGTKIDKDNFNKKIREAINGFQSEINLEKAGCYVDPKFKKDDKKVIAACDTMNSYLKAKITYDFSPSEEVVDSSLISQWVSVDDNMEVVFNQEAIMAYIQTLSEKYDTYGKNHSFVTGNGNTVDVVAKGYGWRINRDEEYQKLVENIKKGEEVKREPVYLNKALSHEGNDFGNTYAEVDLSGQQIFFFKDGKCVLNSPCVTGNTSAGHGTPDGIYTLAYKAKDTVLRGKVMPDGTYEYESPVSFWMPFNGGIGFHDASWRNSFGGSIYQSNGSHGCINLPYDAAASLYSYISAGTPVICHY